MFERRNTWHNRVVVLTFRTNVVPVCKCLCEYELVSIFSLEVGADEKIPFLAVVMKKLILLSYLLNLEIVCIQLSDRFSIVYGLALSNKVR